MAESNFAARPGDVDLLQEAVKLGIENGRAGQEPFGALAVRDGEVLGTGVNTCLRDKDPTAHAEVAAVRAACQKCGGLDLAGATVISSCEPCAMCLTVCEVARVSRIIYAAPKEFVPGIENVPALLQQMQAVLRDLAADQIVYVPTSGADEPFTVSTSSPGSSDTACGRHV